MRIVQWRLAAWVALAFGIGAGPVFAAPTTKTTGHSTKAPKTVPSTGVSSSAPGTSTGTGQTNHKAHLETAMSLLHDAHRLVAGAHFPYDGHRAKALKEIDRAVRELSPPKPPTTPVPQTQAHHAPTGHTTGPRPAAPVVQQTQAEEDAKLREALGLLNRAHGRITTNPEAAEDVAAAIAELKAALQVR